MTPILVLLAAAALRQYPFGGRLTLFLLPLFLLLIATGLDAALLPLPPALAKAGLILVVVVAAGAAWRQRPALRQQDVRPAFSYLRSQWRAGDRLYVYWGAWQAASFYAPHYGFHAADMVFGNCYIRQPRLLRAELDRLRGQQRIWVLATHSLQAFAEQEIITGYYDAIGVRRDTLTVAPSPVPPRAPADWVRMRTVSLNFMTSANPLGSRPRQPRTSCCRRSATIRESSRRSHPQARGNTSAVILSFAIATEADVASITELRTAVAESLTREHGRGHWSSCPTEKAVLRRLLASRVLVARSGTDIVGTLRLATKKPWSIDVAYFTAVAKALYLLDMTVAPDLQKQGVGRVAERRGSPGSLRCRSRRGVLLFALWLHGGRSRGL